MATKRDSYLMSGETARRLGVSAQAVRQFVQKGWLEVAAETSAGFRLFLEKDVEALAKRRRENPPRRGPDKGTGGRPPRKKAAKVATKKETTAKKRSAKG